MTEGSRSREIERCAGILFGLAADPSALTLVVVDGEPRSKARPRFAGNGHVYSDRKQVEHEAKLSWHMKRAVREPMRGNVAVACIFYRSTLGRIDVDNMVKQVLDAANDICWEDDYQVTAVTGIIELDRQNPRTVIALAAHNSTMDRAKVADMTCPTCGKSFAPGQRGKLRRFCSVICAGKSTKQPIRLSVATCPTCMTGFQRNRAAQRYCSRHCLLSAIAGRRKGTTVKPICEQCGVVVSRREYRRCRKCFRKDSGFEIETT